MGIVQISVRVYMCVFVYVGGGEVISEKAFWKQAHIFVFDEDRTKIKPRAWFGSWQYKAVCWVGSKWCTIKPGSGLRIE